MLTRIRAVMPFTIDGLLIVAEEWFKLFCLTFTFTMAIAVIAETTLGAAQQTAYRYDNNMMVGQAQFAMLDNRVSRLEVTSETHSSEIAANRAATDELVWESRTVLGGMIVLLLGFGWRKGTERKTQ